MKTEETTFQPGAQFKYLGGIFTIGAMYDNIDTFYFKDYQENVYEGRISTFKRMVRDGQYHMVKAPGLGIEAGNLGEIEAGSPADSQPPENELITCEALEKEGWEKVIESNHCIDFTNGSVMVQFIDEFPPIIFIVTSEFNTKRAKGVSSMSDLRTLTYLINGQK